ncbi:MAG: BrnA antitoxin family protein [Oceanicaulis sp.]
MPSKKYTGPTKPWSEIEEWSDEEEAAINAGIAEDPDTWEATAEDFKRAKKFHELDIELQDMLLRARLPGRPAKSEAEKKARVNVTLDREVHEALKRKAAELERGGASTFINDLLRRELKLDEAS